MAGQASVGDQATPFVRVTVFLAQIQLVINLAGSHRPTVKLNVFSSVGVVSVPRHSGYYHFVRNLNRHRIIHQQQPVIPRSFPA